MFHTKTIPLLLLTICHTSTAWTTLQTSKVILGAAPSLQSKNPLLLGVVVPRAPPLTVLSETASSSEDNLPKRKRKRKKKVQVVEDDEEEEAPVVELQQQQQEEEEIVEPTPVVELKPRDDAPVQLEVTNILASDAEPEPSAVAQISNMLSSVMGSKEESAAAAPTTTSTASSSPASSYENKPLDDSMSQLLEDARMMTEEEKDSKGGLLSDEEGTGVKQMIGDALSTIVTVDFFVVVGFLFWFLLGIFSRSVFNDDTIQIAFNNNFEKLVQPALGVLMIAALGGNFFKEKEEEYDL
eukprot:CAMPEP_0116145416 /NCGR_PEP_ID=MMETSP0329-20121206/16579_1 /TAXON_ID=697910 /ORGANISM="Pseudo-nitzschia arenysensis, Strain B593" /LENGTH=296 /DNA_ID=CAMNT_0003641015 /DNA_START=84 /DNA_END=974 /DNA_ORIENTATION=-